MTIEQELERAQREEPEQMYYAGNSFFSSWFIGTAYSNGFADDDLTPISRETETNARRLAHLEALAKSIQIDEHREVEVPQPQAQKFSFKKK